MIILNNTVDKSENMEQASEPYNNIHPSVHPSIHHQNYQPITDNVNLNKISMKIFEYALICDIILLVYYDAATR